MEKIWEDCGEVISDPYDPVRQYIRDLDRLLDQAEKDADIALQENMKAFALSLFENQTISIAVVGGDVILRLIDEHFEFFEINLSKGLESAFEWPTAEYIEAAKALASLASRLASQTPAA